MNTFPDDAEISLILANPRERKLYDVENAFGITDAPNPIFCIDVGNESDMDAELVAVCEECEKERDILEGQMEISDYPGIVPEEVAVNE